MHHRRYGVKLEHTAIGHCAGGYAFLVLLRGGVQQCLLWYDKLTYFFTFPFVACYVSLKDAFGGWIVGFMMQVNGGGCPPPAAW